MATTAPTSLPWALTGCTYDNDGGNDLRNSTVSALWFDAGLNGPSPAVIGPQGGVAGGNGLNVGAPGGMAVSVAPGHFMVPNTASAAAGSYASTLVSAATLAIAAADPSNPRIDIVVAGVTDDGTSSSAGWVQVITGTASASPSAPAAPPNSIILAQVAVAAAVTSITSGNITDTRTYAVAAGGVLRAPKGTVTGYLGMAAWDPVSGTFYHNTNYGAVSTPQQFAVLPFAPVHVTSTSSYSLPTAVAPVPGLSATVACDGQTDLKVTYHIAGFTGLTSEVTYVTIQVAVDGTAIDQTTVQLDATVSAQGGITAIGYTSAAAGNTPGSGSHTVTVQAWASAASGGSPAIHGFAGVVSAYLRVEPVTL